MKTKKIIRMTALILALAAAGSIPARAASGRGRFALGPEIGFTAQSHLDPMEERLGWTTGASFGVQGVYQFSRYPQFGLDYSVGYSFLPRLTIRDVTIGGVTGTYREGLGVLHWFFGGRYYFKGVKWKPYAGLDAGFEYFRRGDIEFRDRFNTLQPTPPFSNHFNFALAPKIGIEFRPTFRWVVGVSMRLPVALRSSGVVPAIQVPITVQAAF